MIIKTGYVLEASFKGEASWRSVSTMFDSESKAVEFARCLGWDKQFFKLNRFRVVRHQTHVSYFYLKDSDLKVPKRLLASVRKLGPIRKPRSIRKPQVQ